MASAAPNPVRPWGVTAAVFTLLGGVIGTHRSSDFQPSEQGLHTPFWWHADLAVAARDHAEDMDRNQFLGHTSSDGTTWEARLHAIYPYETIGEAVAYDPMGTRHAVLSTWICSEQHRAILLGPYDEMGVGVSGSYYAVDVGMAGRDEWLPVASASIGGRLKPS